MLVNHISLCCFKCVHRIGHDLRYMSSLLYRHLSLFLCTSRKQFFKKTDLKLYELLNLIRFNPFYITHCSSSFCSSIVVVFQETLVNSLVRRTKAPNDEFSFNLLVGL